MFLVILLIFIGFLGLLKLSLRKAIALPRCEAAWPVKSFSKNAGVLEVDLRSVASISISLAAGKNVMTKQHRAFADTVEYLAALAKHRFCKLGNNNAISEVWQRRQVKRQEHCKVAAKHFHRYSQKTC